MSDRKTCNICGKKFDGESYHADPAVRLCLSCLTVYLQSAVVDEQNLQQRYADMDQHKWGCE